MTPGGTAGALRWVRAGRAAVLAGAEVQSCGVGAISGRSIQGGYSYAGTRILADRLQQWLKTFLERGRY